MTTPRRYAIVQIMAQHSFVVRDRNTGDAGQTHINSGRNQEWMGEISPDTMVIWTDSRREAEITLGYVQRLFPRNSYALCETREVSYVPAAPATRARFTDEGLIPA